MLQKYIYIFDPIVNFNYVTEVNLHTQVFIVAQE